MAEATQTLVLFKPEEKIIVTEVLAGQNYYLPLDNSVHVFEGTFLQFQALNSEYFFELI